MQRSFQPECDVHARVLQRACVCMLLLWLKAQRRGVWRSVWPRAQVCGFVCHLSAPMTTAVQQTSELLVVVCLQVSPCGQLVAFTLDTVGDERYSLRVQPLAAAGGSSAAGSSSMYQQQEGADAQGLGPRVIWSDDGTALFGCQLVSGDGIAALLATKLWHHSTATCHCINMLL